ncbi:MAG TPA: class II aldolase/adducin family protein [Cyclobacteriaceae bacterium]
MDEGYIKFICHWTNGASLPRERLRGLIYWRNVLYEKQLIGAYPSGIGFGNISVRYQKDQFIISGSATGNLEKLNEQHFSLVSDFDISKNELHCFGPIKASSESMSHGTIYRLDDSFNAVMHIHNPALWNRLLYHVPTTKANVPYGTPEMAREIERLFREENLSDRKIITMAGHEEGIFTMGADLDEAGNVLLGYFNCLS